MSELFKEGALGSGDIIKTNGYRLFVSGTLDLRNASANAIQSMATTSAEKLEKVVNAPKKPVMSASRQAGSSSGMAWNKATATPTK